MLTLFRHGFRGREYQRTCRACGTTWTVPRRLARASAPSGHRRGYALPEMRSAGVKMFSESYMKTLGDLKDHRDAAADHEVELLVAARRCPRCRSDDYEQARSR
jgi:hypothetical protein